jgi:hypothetical protein
MGEGCSRTTPRKGACRRRPLPSGWIVIYSKKAGDSYQPGVLQPTVRMPRDCKPKYGGCSGNRTRGDSQGFAIGPRIAFELDKILSPLSVVRPFRPSMSSQSGSNTQIGGDALLRARKTRSSTADRAGMARVGEACRLPGAQSLRLLAIPPGNRVTARSASRRQPLRATTHLRPSF